MKILLTRLISCVLLTIPILATARDLSFVTIEVPPWASLEKSSGQKIGLFPEVVRELERRTGHRISMSLQPFARIDHELESGREDCTIIVWTEARDRVVVKGELVSNHEVGVVPRRSLALNR